MGLDGPITIRRARFQCEKTNRMVLPLDEVLDLPSGEATASLAKRALRLGTRMSFADLQEELLAQHDVRLTDSTLDTLMQKAGGVAEADRQAELDVLAGLPRGLWREEKVPVERPAPRRLYVSCDGITYRTRYREDGPERFGLCLWQLAVQCGLLDCPEVIFISDGGTWCGTVAELYFMDATRILDWYHLAEYIWKAGRGLYSNTEKTARRWVEDCLDHLHDSGGGGLLTHLERCRSARGEHEAEALDTLMNYLRPRLAITDYPKYRANGYVIGSGMMESSCKQVVGQRLKGTGMQWSEEGALAMSALVSQRLNGTWDRFWTGRPLQRAA
jgi:hypothetical protein